MERQRHKTLFRPEIVFTVRQMNYDLVTPFLRSATPTQVARSTTPNSVTSEAPSLTNSETPSTSETPTETKRNDVSYCFEMNPIEIVLFGKFVANPCDGMFYRVRRSGLRKVRTPTNRRPPTPAPFAVRALPRLRRGTSTSTTTTPF